ncbi:MAG TPA: polyprenol monophosphomannose synthase [bacterium (Candidatus Stahlbacteria)]|nr:polyprenol monophosphomannose synthase [Candidatus Stahlbacteria bacterium]
MPKGLVIIPTYNEVENISAVIDQVVGLGEDLDILIVDDNSTDGTREIIEKKSQQNSRINLLKRPSKMGLGTAYIAGFKYAISNKYEYAFEMDADLSHNPDDLLRFIAELKKYDFVVGSRYINGVSVINWPMSRLLLSYFANLYAKIIAGVPIKDLTSGFIGYRTEVLKEIDIDSIKTDGYGFQIEIKYKLYRRGFKHTEIPIIFIERRSGHSKMSKGIIWQAFWLVWKLGVFGLFSR